MDTKILHQNRRVKKIIIGLGLVVILVVGYLLSPANTFKTISHSNGFDYSILSHINAFINTLAAFILLIALLVIQRGYVKLHRSLMTTVLLMEIVFLINYIIYHLNAGHVIYGDINHDGLISTLERASFNTLARLAYFIILITHIIGSTFIVPLVLYAFYLGYTSQIELHKKLVRWVYPLWLYILVSGVLAYLMISPYYTTWDRWIPPTILLRFLRRPV